MLMDAILVWTQLESITSYIIKLYSVSAQRVII